MLQFRNWSRSIDFDPAIVAAVRANHVARSAFDPAVDAESAWSDAGNIIACTEWRKSPASSDHCDGFLKRAYISLPMATRSRT